MMLVDAEALVSNISIRKETERLLEEHPWAFEFDPRQSYKDIKIWD